MIPTMHRTSKTLDATDLRMLAHQSGPCVTIEVPTFRPGDNTGSRHLQLGQLTQTAVSRLRDINRSIQVNGGWDTSLESLQRQVANVDDGKGGPGLTLYWTPNFQAIYDTPAVTRSHVEVGGTLFLMPAVVSAGVSQEFHILGISKKHIRLWRYSQGICTELALPAGVPASLTAAEDFDRPDHDLENRSTAGPAMAAGRGGLRKVRFGTSSDAEAHGEYMLHFLEHVERGLKDTIHHLPLFLAGVHEDVSRFRKISKHPNIFAEQCLGNPENASNEQIATHARMGALKEYYSHAREVLEALNDKPDKITGDVSRILRAAREGRVRTLCVDEAARMPAHGLLDDSYDGEDAYNACVVETLRHGGEVVALKAGSMNGMGDIACLLRY